ncbi:MAG: hypothetical protein EOP45_20400, partial [Sphingobacteriaceae bacterium]
PGAFKNNGDTTILYQESNFGGASVTVAANANIPDLLNYTGNAFNPNHVYSCRSIHTDNPTTYLVLIATLPDGGNVTYIPFATVKSTMLSDLAAQYNDPNNNISNATYNAIKSAISGMSCTTFYGGAIALPSNYCTLVPTTTTATPTTTTKSPNTTTTVAPVTSTSSFNQMQWIYIILLIMVSLILVALGFKYYLQKRIEQIVPTIQKV